MLMGRFFLVVNKGEVSKVCLFESWDGQTRTAVGKEKQVRNNIRR